MEKNTEFSKISFKKAKRRVADIKNFYWWVIGYIILATFLLYGNFAQKIFHFSRDYVIIMLILQGVFLLGVGLYLFLPALHGWEDRKIRRLMSQYKNKDNEQ